jgi:L-ascorbate metabolism protein UlaG (beta-lactamase superfamily)
MPCGRAFAWAARLAAAALMTLVPLLSVAHAEGAGACAEVISQARSPIALASYRMGIAETEPVVELAFLGHSSFLITSPGGVTIVTDYNGYMRPRDPPNVVTMNHAHTSHYTDDIDPGIKLVLRGWREDGRPSGYDVNFKDVRIRSVATNIRTWAGETERYGNSIFVFEIANMCIAHLGHLHHTLTQQQLNDIGRIDLVMAPVDGSMTLDLDGMVEVLQGLKAQIIVPMHFFSSYTLDRFLARMRQNFAISYNETPSLVLSKTTLPAAPTIMVLPGH